MILEILGNSKAKIDGDVKVIFKNGEIVIYCSEKIQYLILNPSEIRAIVVEKKH